MLNDMMLFWPGILCHRVLSHQCAIVVFKDKGMSVERVELHGAFWLNGTHVYFVLLAIDPIGFDGCLPLILKSDRHLIWILRISLFAVWWWC